MAPRPPARQVNRKIIYVDDPPPTRWAAKPPGRNNYPCSRRANVTATTIAVTVIGGRAIRMPVYWPTIVLPSRSRWSHRRITRHRLGRFK